MLGIIGFSTAAVVIALYAMSIWKLYRNNDQQQRSSLVSAYSLLAVCMAVWAAGLAIGDEGIAASIVVGDILLAIATVLLIPVIVGKSYQTAATIVMSLLVAVGLYVRFYVVESTAYVTDGLLVFNLTREVAGFFLLVFGLVWLPATMLMLYRIRLQKRLLPFVQVMAILHIILVMVTGYFILARRPMMVVMLFIALVIIFALNTFANIVVDRLSSKTSKKGQHATGK